MQVGTASSEVSASILRCDDNPLSRSEGLSKLIRIASSLNN